MYEFLQINLPDGAKAKPTPLSRARVEGEADAVSPLVAKRGESGDAGDFQTVFLASQSTGLKLASAAPDRAMKESAQVTTEQDDAVEGGGLPLDEELEEAELIRSTVPGGEPDDRDVERAKTDTETLANGRAAVEPDGPAAPPLVSEAKAAPRVQGAEPEAAERRETSTVPVPARAGRSDTMPFSRTTSEMRQGTGLPEHLLANQDAKLGASRDTTAKEAVIPSGSQAPGQIPGDRGATPAVPAQSAQISAMNGTSPASAGRVTNRMREGTMAKAIVSEPNALAAGHVAGPDDLTRNPVLSSLLETAGPRANTPQDVRDPVVPNPVRKPSEPVTAPGGTRSLAGSGGVPPQPGDAGVSAPFSSLRPAVPAPSDAGTRAPDASAAISAGPHGRVAEPASSTQPRPFRSADTNPPSTFVPAPSPGFAKQQPGQGYLTMQAVLSGPGTNRQASAASAQAEVAQTPSTATIGQGGQSTPAAPPQAGRIPTPLIEVVPLTKSGKALEAGMAKPPEPAKRVSMAPASPGIAMPPKTSETMATSVLSSPREAEEPRWPSPHRFEAPAAPDKATPAGPKAAQQTSLTSANSPTGSVASGVTGALGAVDEKVRSGDPLNPAAPAEIRGATESNGPLRTTQPQGAPYTPEQARNVTTQIAAAIQRNAERSIEIMLSPAELGRLRINLSPGEAGLAVSIFADRGETLDLLRRNVDMLAQEFRAIGQEGASFSFASGGGQDGRASSQELRMTSDAGVPGDPAIAETAEVIPPPRLYPSQRMDIRI